MGLSVAVGLGVRVMVGVAVGVSVGRAVGGKGVASAMGVGFLGKNESRLTLHHTKAAQAKRISNKPGQAGARLAGGVMGS